jgi:hypothetical protein
MTDLAPILARWQLDTKTVREQRYRAATPRERWHAIGMVARGGHERLRELRRFSERGGYRAPPGGSSC